MAAAMADNGLHVMYACPDHVISRFGTNALDAEDRARAARMSNTARHKHFTAGRALLRHSLSIASGNAVEPDAWHFATGEFGKPCVIPDLPQINFSISHGEGLLAVATCPVLQVGIDIELVCNTDDSEPVAEQLTQREKAWLTRQPEADRWASFLHLWTAKESVSKLLGTGCGVDFSEIDVDVPAGCVRYPDGLTRTGAQVDINQGTIDMQASTYCLSVACM
jgi:phosphopantetheinyl transferase